MALVSRTTFGDTCLEDMGIVVEYVHDDPPAARVETEEAPGMDGVMAYGSTLAEREITLDCRALLERWDDFDRLMEQLALLVGRSGRLETRRHPGESYEAYLTAIQEGERLGGTGIGSFTMTFMAPDPERTLSTRSVTVQTGMTAQVIVGGTRGTSVSVVSDAAYRSSSSMVWGVRFDEGVFVHVRTGSDDARRVSIDCDTRTVTVNGETAMLTLDSDWPELGPGAHTIRIDQGYGDATVTWTERSI